MKLSQIKAELKKMLLQMSVVKTNAGVLQYEGEELAEGIVVKIVNEDGTEEIPTGEFTTEDNKKLTIENGEIKSIEEIEIEPVEVVEPAEEETTEPEVTEEPAEEPAEEEQPEEEATEPEATEEDTKVAELEAKIAELEAQLADALAKIAELTETTEAMFSNIQKMSMAKPAAQEFENIKKQNKTGNAKLDKFLAGLKG